MQVEKLILWLSILASSGSLLFHLLLLPNIYNELNELVGLVQGEVQQFKTDTNHAWDALLSLQEAFDLTERLKRTVSEQAVARRQPFISTKQKHNVFFSTRLPAWCQCEVTKPKCPPGARGPPGPNGSPGIPGSDGPPGQDNYKAQSAPLCDLPHVGCVRCPAGPPGRKGLTGGVGRPGPPGAPGVDGIHSNRGRPGKPGPPGNTGKPGRSGPRGDRGNPGRNGVVPVSKPGPLGKMGPAGREGSSGRPGKAGTPGIPGPMGPPGAPGIQGKRAGSGQPGSRGRTGAPGNDATYCPCPSRTMYAAANFKN